jgi:hypothetical protein
MNLPCEDNDIFGWLSGESDDVLIGCFKLHGFLNRSPEAAMAKTHPWTLRNQFFPAHIVCLEEGKQVTMLKRHLRTAHGLIPEQYRPKWGLPARYPIVHRTTRKSAPGWRRKAVSAGTDDEASEPFPHISSQSWKPVT